MRRIIGRFVERILEHSEGLSPRRVVDLGCGEGIVAGALRRRLPGVEYLGIDSSPTAIEVARSLNPDCEFQVGDVFDQVGRPGWADLVLCLEVVEHLDSPGDAVDRIMSWTSAHALVSVPWEPWFRIGNLLRGRHFFRLGNHPEHVQQFRPKTFLDLMQRHARHANVSTCFPWLIAHASHRRTHRQS